MADPTIKHKLNIDDVLQMIIEGESHREISRRTGVSISSLFRFLMRTTANSEAYKRALMLSATALAEKAEKVFLELKEGATTAEIAKAKGLADYYRWMAGCKNPKVFSPKAYMSSTDDDDDTLVKKKRVFKIVEEEAIPLQQVKSYQSTNDDLPTSFNQ